MPTGPLVSGAWAAPLVAVLHAGEGDPALQGPPCPAGHCVELSLDDPPCTALDGPVPTVVLTGHSRPPVYLGRSPTVVAERIACLEPELVVLDTCYGFSAPLLAALADQDVDALVVGTVHQLSVEGLRYHPAFFEPGLSADARAHQVQPRYAEVLQRWTPDVGDLERSTQLVAGWDPATLEAHLQRVHPNLVRVPLGEAERWVLHEVAPARFVRPEP